MHVRAHPQTLPLRAARRRTGELRDVKAKLCLLMHQVALHTFGLDYLQTMAAAAVASHAGITVRLAVQ
jgi:hypothetical protein